MIRRSAILTLAAAATLAACSDNADNADEQAVTDLERPETDGEAEAAAEALVAGDFAALKLGAKVEGPQGDEITGALGNAQGNFADIRSYVSCPAGMDPCDPASAPEGTVDRQ